MTGMLLINLSKTSRAVVRLCSRTLASTSGQATVDVKSTAEKPKFSETPAFTKYRSGHVALSGSGKRDLGYLKHATDDNFRGKQAFVILGSTSVFLIYFCILREENDIDEELSKPLWKRLPSLEKDVLMQLIHEGTAKGKDVSEHEKRLAELERVARS